MHRPSPALRLASFLALAAALLTAAQSAFILLRGDAFCLNEGCRVVEDLTRVPPLVVNLAGLVFFLALIFGLRASGSLRRRLPRFVAPLLLAGLAVEGVLFGFQLFVAEAFCSYCLAVLGAVVALNLLLGARQAAHGLLFFLAALLAFSSLELERPGQGGAALRTASSPAAPARRRQRTPPVLFLHLRPLRTGDRVAAHKLRGDRPFPPHRPGAGTGPAGRAAARRL